MKKNEKENKNGLKFTDLDEPLRKHYVISFTYALFIMILGIALAIALKNIFFFAGVSFMALLYAGLNWYQVLCFLENSAINIEGYCVENKTESYMGIKRRFFTIRTEDERYIKVYNDKGCKKVDIDNVVIIYLPKSALFQLNEDTYKINSLYFVYVKKNRATKK